MAEPMDPNIEALDPSIRALRKAQARETLGTAGRILRGEPEPPRPDYTDQRIKLIGMLDNLRKLETELRAEKEKTGRVSIAAEATLMKAIAGLGEANIAAVSDVEVARLGAYTKRLEDLGAAIERSGIRRPEQLKEAAISSLNALGAYAKNGAVTPGQEPAFAAEVLKGLRTIDTTNPADAGLVSVYADELQNRYGIALEDFITAPGTSANVVPATITSIGTALQRGETAQLQNAEFEKRQESERDKIYNETVGPLTLQPGSWLGKQLTAFESARGGAAAPTTMPAPAATAPRAEKEAYLQAINPALKLSEDGQKVTLTIGPEGPTRTLSYDSVVRMGAEGTPRLTGVSMTDFLDQQEKYILKELDRLENATDFDSVRLRKMILASPELATWAQQNGYGEFRPEQQFKALLDARRVETAEQNKAFRAKRDADILTREGAPIRKAGAAVRDFFRRPEEKVGPGARRSREDSADLTGGATTPAGKTDNTGATESDPKKQQELKDLRTLTFGPSTKDAASQLRLGEGSAGIMPINVEGAYREAETEAEAKAKKMAAESAARPERTLPADTAFETAVSTGRAKRALGRVGDDPTYAEITAPLRAALDAGDTAEAGRLTRELDRAIGRRSFPLGKGEGEMLGTETLGPVVGLGREMPEDAKAKARAEYQAAQATGEQTRAIPQGRRGFLTGPSAEDVAAINATLPPIDETDVPEPPVEGPTEEGVDTVPQAAPGTALAEAEPDMTDTMLQQEVGGAGLSAQAPTPAEEAQVAAAPKAGARGTQAKPQSTLPFFESFGAEAATEAATNAMSQAQSAEEQIRARRKALLMGTPMQA